MQNITAITKKGETPEHAQTRVQRRHPEAKVEPNFARGNPGETGGELQNRLRKEMMKDTTFTSRDDYIGEFPGLDLEHEDQNFEPQLINTLGFELLCDEVNVQIDDSMAVFQGPVPTCLPAARKLVWYACLLYRLDRLQTVCPGRKLLKELVFQPPGNFSIPTPIAKAIESLAPVRYGNPQRRVYPTILMPNMVLSMWDQVEQVYVPTRDRQVGNPLPDDPDMAVGTGIGGSRPYLNLRDLFRELRVLGYNPTTVRGVPGGALGLATGDIMSRYMRWVGQCRRGWTLWAELDTTKPAIEEKEMSWTMAILPRAETDYGVPFVEPFQVGSLGDAPQSYAAESAVLQWTVPDSLRQTLYRFAPNHMEGDLDRRQPPVVEHAVSREWLNRHNVGYHTQLYRFVTRRTQAIVGVDVKRATYVSKGAKTSLV